MANIFRAGLLLSLCFLFGCVNQPVSPELTKRESDRFHQFLEETFEFWVSRSPETQSYLGRKTNYGKLDNYSEERHLEDLEHTKRFLKELKNFDYRYLNESSQISYRVFKRNLEIGIRAWKWRNHGYPINQMFGYHTKFMSLLMNVHQVKDKADAEAYISRVGEIKRVFAERLDKMKRIEKAGVFPPQFVFDKVDRDIVNIISGQPFDKGKKKSPLLDDFTKKTLQLDISKAEKNQLIKELEQVLVNSFKPSYQELRAYLKELSKKSTGNRGVWSLPDGEEYYRYRLEKVTSLELTPNEIHQIGLDEVRRIHGEMNKVKESVGFKGTLQDFFNHVKNDPKFYFPQTKKGRDQYLKRARLVIAEMKESLPKMFNVLPKADLIVKPVEDYREKSAGLAFYDSPSLDGSRPGIYYVNLSNMKDHPTFKIEALAYHEGVPGHHMQLTIAQELKDLPMVRKMGHVTAYSEGWGLYSEYLPKEFGFYKDPYSDFGRLQMELWRACRLVVDTGIHSQRWTRERAIKYLLDNTPNDPVEIRKGIERYFIMPGQATAYKIGMLKILELRKKAKAKLGEAFDIKDFHDVILKGGPLPLPVLEEQVDQWITRTLRKRG